MKSAIGGIVAVLLDRCAVALLQGEAAAGMGVSLAVAGGAVDVGIVAAFVQIDLLLWLLLQ